MPSKRVLAERIAGNERLRRQQERWERERRTEDRSEWAKNDEDLNRVRLQLQEQAGSFATKDLLTAVERTLENKVDSLERSILARIEAAIQNLNEEGTEGYRETEAARKARDETTKEILSGISRASENSATNRRWLIGLAVAVIFGIVGNLISLSALLIHLWTQ